MATTCYRQLSKRHVTAQAEAALLDSDTTQGAEVGGETDGDSTASDDSGPGRKRQLEGIDEVQPKKKKKQQPITDYLAATTAGLGDDGGAQEGAEGQDED